MKDIIAKINYYTKLSRERDLTKEEAEDREKWRKLYLEQFKSQVKNHLESIKIVDGEDKNILQ